MNWNRVAFWLLVWFSLVVVASVIAGKLAAMWITSVVFGGWLK